MANRGDFFQTNLTEMCFSESCTKTGGLNLSIYNKTSSLKDCRRLWSHDLFGFALFFPISQTGQCFSGLGKKRLVNHLIFWAELLANFV